MNKTKNLYSNLSVSLLILEVIILMSYFINYQPEIGAKYLMINSFIGVIGLLIAIKSSKFKPLLLSCHTVIILFFPIMFIGSAYFGF
ncbi:hypothetical protein [Vagococcus hydrophili]|uniref:Uncharacterized protein n=1 Tax=Vagococcus hydrophili TaxID=2714947 RepID=A0A6G8ARX6_9ENTE|nr:hypothetical protein [Vagococcus hydrophili]QIL47675.1 hypothetical protein G7082_03545 [Vagococcus hydrophili]